MFRLSSIQEVDFPNWCISFHSYFFYVQTQKYILSILHFRKSQEVWIKYEWSINKVPFYFCSVFTLHLYFFLGSSLQAYFYWTSRIWSINEVYIKYTSHIVFFVRVGHLIEVSSKPAMNKSGPFGRFSTRVWQKACVNTVRHEMVCDVYFPFPKVL